MFDNLEKPSSLFAEIRERGAGWRAAHLDLPITLLFLSRIKRALVGLNKDGDEHKIWSRLKAQGKSLARRRALFVAAEAVGRLQGDVQVDKRATISSALGVVIEEGTTLDKVRALRALSFIPSDESVHILKSGMQDPSAWVQATALNILLSMNLLLSAPRTVLIEFLIDRFERQGQLEAVLDPRTVVKNFHVNKGLLIALLKAPGGKRLALLSLRLWVTAVLKSLWAALKAGAEVAYHVLGTAAAAGFRFLVKTVFVKVYRSPFGVARKAASVVYGLFIWLPYKILSIPLWARHVKWSLRTLRERDIYLAFLDYIFVSLTVIALLPNGILWLVIALIVYSLLLAQSSTIETRSVGEGFRLNVRCAGAVVIALYANRTGQAQRAALALTLLAVAQIIWLMPLLARGLDIFIQGVVHLLVDLGEAAASRVREQVGEVIESMSERASRERMLREAAAAIGSLFLTLGRNLRPHIKPFAFKALRLALFLVIGYYLMRKYILSVPNVSKLTGPEIGTLLVALKPYLYFFVLSLLGVVIPCALLLSVFHLLWDELWLVERVTFRTRSRNLKRFKSDSDFLAYVFTIVRDQTLATGLRVRAASALEQVPLASQAYVDQLTDLAEEDLPIGVSDAVARVADDAEKRLRRRARPDEFKMDMGLIDQQDLNIWKPCELLLPRIRKGLVVALLLPSLMAGAVWLYLGVGDRRTDMASLVCLGCGCGLLLVYVCLAGRQGEFVKRSLLCGLVLLISVFARPLQLPLFEIGWGFHYQNGVLGLVELSAFSALIIPTVVTGAIARAGYTVYLLGSDVVVNLKLKGKPNLVQRRLERLKQQVIIIRPVLILSVCAVFAQSRLLQTYLDRHGEQLPSFAATSKKSEVQLQGFPTDGRVVRVAIVRADGQFDPAPTRAPEKIATPEEMQAAVVSALKEGGVYPLEPDSVWGDLWVTFEAGKFRGWWTSPLRCLQPSGAVGDAVTFDLNSLCSYEAKVRLVAVVYDARRSKFIKEIPAEPGVPARVDSLDPVDRWLLLDTNSPFVKAVWSPVF